MNKQAVIAVYDIGKTNKKLLLFDGHYNIVHQITAQFEETTDDDGFSCEDLDLLCSWMADSFSALAIDERFEVKAVNFSGYGASFVYIDSQGKPLPPLSNYLKPFPEPLKKKFYEDYGGEAGFARETASPVLGNLNSGMQLYRLKYEQPGLFGRLAFALHLPQFLSYLLTWQPASDLTSLGCHTNLWNFEQCDYHAWVRAEGINRLMAPIEPCTKVQTFQLNGRSYVAGYGLHDSSAALIPYLKSFQEPFILISTGTWCISLNPFNEIPLSHSELQQDCLSYLTFEGKPVKASRLFAGHEHEQQTIRLSAHFNQPPQYFKTVRYDAALLHHSPLQHAISEDNAAQVMKGKSVFEKRDLNDFANYEAAYHCLISDIMELQVYSTGLVLNGTAVKRIFVDGGFSNNPIFMHLLAAAFPHLETFAASVAQASALGAALVIHEHWNAQPVPANLIALRYYSAKQGD